MYNKLAVQQIARKILQRRLIHIFINILMHKIMIKFIINVPEETVEQFTSIENLDEQDVNRTTLIDKLIGFVVKDDVLKKASNGEDVVLDDLFSPDCDEKTKMLQGSVLRSLFMATIAVNINSKKKEQGGGAAKRLMRTNDCPEIFLGAILKIATLC